MGVLAPTSSINSWGYSWGYSWGSTPTHPDYYPDCYQRTLVERTLAAFVSGGGALFGLRGQAHRDGESQRRCSVRMAQRPSSTTSAPGRATVHLRGQALLTGQHARLPVAQTDRGVARSERPDQTRAPPRHPRCLHRGRQGSMVRLLQRGPGDPRPRPTRAGETNPTTTAGPSRSKPTSRASGSALLHVYWAERHDLIALLSQLTIESNSHDPTDDLNRVRRSWGRALLEIWSLT